MKPSFIWKFSHRRSDRASKSCARGRNAPYEIYAKCCASHSHYICRICCIVSVRGWTTKWVRHTWIMMPGYLCTVNRKIISRQRSAVTCGTSTISTLCTRFYILWNLILFFLSSFVCSFVHSVGGSAFCVGFLSMRDAARNYFLVSMV